MLQNVWILPCIVALRWWPGTYVDSWGTYALITTLLSYPYCHAIVVAWASRNSGSVGTRTGKKYCFDVLFCRGAALTSVPVSAALYNMTVQAGSIVSSNIYRDDDAPLYHRGNDVLFALDLLAIFLFLATKAYYSRLNRTRARRWDAMSEEQRAEYIRTTRDEGNKRLDFRFAH